MRSLNENISKYEEIAVVLTKSENVSNRNETLKRFKDIEIKIAFNAEKIKLDLMKELDIIGPTMVENGQFSKIKIFFLLGLSIIVSTTIIVFSLIFFKKG